MLSLRGAVVAVVIIHTLYKLVFKYRVAFIVMVQFVAKYI